MAQFQQGFIALLTLFRSYFLGIIHEKRAFLPFVIIFLCAAPLLLFFCDAPLIALTRTLPTQIVAVFKVITHLGLSWWVLMPTGGAVLYFLFFTQEKPLRAFYVFMSVAVSGLFIQPFKWSIGRARPPLFETEGVFSLHPFTKNPLFYSFPSGHATSAAALTTCLCLLFPRFKWIFIPIGCAAILSRTIIGAHYPSDIFTGTLIGMAFSTVGFLWLKSVEKLNSY